jgi:hypothetical protein
LFAFDGQKKPAMQLRLQVSASHGDGVADFDGVGVCDDDGVSDGVCDEDGVTDGVCDEVSEGGATQELAPAFDVSPDGHVVQAVDPIPE